MQEKPNKGRLYLIKSITRLNLKALKTKELNNNMYFGELTKQELKEYRRFVKLENT